MPAKKNPSHATLEQINAGRIIKRLQAYIFDTKGEATMSASQVTAALALLKKVHPDLAAQTVDVSGAVTVEVLQVASRVTLAKAS
jgi:hypothetical protein